MPPPTTMGYETRGAMRLQNYSTKRNGTGKMKVTTLGTNMSQEMKFEKETNNVVLTDGNVNVAKQGTERKKVRSKRLVGTRWEH